MNSLLCDLHTHTLDDPRDHHVWHKAEELIDEAAKKHYGALAVTLHGKQVFSESWRQYAADRGITLIPGVEQDIEGCHVLLLNFDRDAADGIRNFQELAKARRPENLVIAAHPYFPGEICLGDKLLEYAECFDAIEVTGFYHPYWDPNQKALRVAKQLAKPVVGNSDTHALSQFGKTASFIAVEGDTTPLSIVQAIKAGRVTVASRALKAWEMALIGYQVVGRGYFPWVNYKRRRGHSASV